MSVPLFQNNELYRPYADELKQITAEVIDSGSFILGENVAAFESEFASYLGVDHVVGVANGTDALTLALTALGIGAGDEVIVPSYTFYATAECVPHTGAKPVFCDVDSDTYCVTAETIEAALTDKTKAVIVVHLFGNVAPMDEICALAESKGIKVIEDTAQATGATFKGKKAGTFGDASTFSFFPSKNLFCFGDGGAVATNDETIASRVDSLRRHGTNLEKVKSEYEYIGYNSRLDGIQAAILRRNLKELDGWNAGRREVADKYEKLGLGQHLDLPVAVPGSEHAWHMYVARSPRRTQLLEVLAKREIGSRAVYAQPIHRQAPMAGFAKGSELPGTDLLAAEAVALPMSPNLSDKQISEVVGAVADLG